MSDSSFFASSASAASASPQQTPRQQQQLQQTGASPYAAQTPLPPVSSPEAAAAGVPSGATAAAVGYARTGLLPFDAHATPMPGQLSFTPALQTGGFAPARHAAPRAMAAPNSASFFATPSVQQQQQALRHQQQHLSTHPHHSPAPPAFSTTPSVPVPLDFPTPRTHSKHSSVNVRPAPSAPMHGQLPSYRPHAGRPATVPTDKPALPLSAFANGLPSAAGGHVLGSAGKLPLAQLLVGDHAFGAATALPPLPAGPPIRIPRAPLRALIRSCLARGHLSGAVFYSDKLATLERFSHASLLQLAEAYARDGQHQRAVHLLRQHHLLRLPACNMAEWQQQQRAHTEKQRLRLASGLSDDSDPNEPSPLTLRMECLYTGLQSLLEMKAHEEVLNDCLPDESVRVATVEPEDEAAQWQATLNAALAAVAPVPPSMRDATDHVESIAATVREIIGEQEVTLILTLLKYHALMRESATESARSQQDRSQSGGADDVNMTPAHAGDHAADADFAGPIDLCASLCFLRASVYECQSNKYKAVLWYKLCLRFDIRHVDAFERLTSKRLLSTREEQQLFTSGALTFPPHMEWLRCMWLNRVEVEQMDAFERQQQIEREQAGGPGAVVSVGSLEAAAISGESSAITVASPAKSSLLTRYRLLSVTYQLGDNHDLLSSVIAHRYAQGEYSACLKLCEHVQTVDPFFLPILPTFLACLVELQMKARLFFVAHRLVAAYPRRAVSWHAVGCYYLLLGALDVARRFFFKATRLDALSPYAWVGFGHTFSYADESEQALLSYRTAHRLFEGAHVPLMCMGQEYLRTNHLLLAKHFLQHAQQHNPHDPLPHNEQGVLAYKSGDYAEAAKAFLRCLALVKNDALQHWEATLFNLGHAYRKMRRYPEAISAYNRALSVSVRGFSCVCALGFTYHLQGDLSAAVGYYHQALGLHPRDAFATDMLDRALIELAQEEMDAQ